MFVPYALAGLACMAATADDEPSAVAAVGETRAELGGRSQPITAAALRHAATGSDLPDQAMARPLPGA